MIKSSLGHFTGLVFFKGTPAADADQPVGKNLVSKVPCEMATVLGLDNPVSFTFHSLWRSSATTVADSGAFVQQLMDFYGWANPSMPEEYVSSSKASVKSMADKLQGPSCAKDAQKFAKKNLRENSANFAQQIYNVIQNSDKIVIIEHFHGNNFTMFWSVQSWELKNGGYQD